MLQYGYKLTNEKLTNCTSGLIVLRLYLCHTLVSTMRNWCKRLTNSFVIAIRNEIIQRKYYSYPMAATTLAIILFMSGAAFAYFATFLPTVLLSFFSSKQHMGLSAHSAHDTSIILRVRQQQIPPNPGKPSKLYYKCV